MGHGRTHTHLKMTIQPPKKNPTNGSYSLALNPPVSSPRLVTDGTKWILTSEWSDWASTQRSSLIGELISHGTWFSRPPRRDIIEPLFAPWSGKKTTQGVEEFFCKSPEVPGSGSAVWSLTGLTMSATAITPVWSIEDFQESPEQDTISLFGDADTADGSEGDEEDEETKEIRFEDIESASPATAEPTRIRNREWEARKFMAKERVREARLKAQIADRMAAKEESRFYTLYGELSDNESHFSEYDLTDDENESDAPSE